ncbi:MAG: hypothetical protein ACJA1C_000120 [Crocinitomicaceae bacterium]|jgi:hypothetical protein
MKSRTLYIILALILISCHHSDFKLQIKNNTDFDIYVITYDTSSLDDYPNMVLDFDLIPKDSTKAMWSFNQSWEDCVKNSRNNGLNIFVIHRDTVEKYDRNPIVKTKNYYKQVFLTLEELEALKWKVVIE